jgi:hypothetical protein
MQHPEMPEAPMPHSPWQGNPQRHGKAGARIMSAIVHICMHATRQE